MRIVIINCKKLKFSKLPVEKVRILTILKKTLQVSIKSYFLRKNTLAFYGHNNKLFESKMKKLKVQFKIVFFDNFDDTLKTKTFK